MRLIGHALHSLTHGYRHAPIAKLRRCPPCGAFGVSRQLSLGPAQLPSRQTINGWPSPICTGPSGLENMPPSRRPPHLGLTA